MALDLRFPDLQKAVLEKITAVSSIFPLILVVKFTYVIPTRSYDDGASSTSNQGITVLSDHILPSMGSGKQALMYRDFATQDPG